MKQKKTIFGLILLLIILISFNFGKLIAQFYHYYKLPPDLSLIFNFVSILILGVTLYYIARNTLETKRMTDIQYKAMLFPSVSLAVKTQYYIIDQVFAFQVHMIYTNHTNYNTIIQGKINGFWFDEKIEIPMQLQKFALPPQTEVEYIIDFIDDKTTNYAREKLGYDIDSRIWVDNNKNPIYWEITYSAQSEFYPSPTKTRYLYNLRFKSDRIENLIPQIDNAYAIKFAEFPDLKTEYINKCILYAISEKQNK
jgi:hypothetical protein